MKSNQAILLIAQSYWEKTTQLTAIPEPIATKPSAKCHGKQSVWKKLMMRSSSPRGLLHNSATDRATKPIRLWSTAPFWRALASFASIYIALADETLRRVTKKTTPTAHFRLVIQDIWICVGMNNSDTLLVTPKISKVKTMFTMRKLQLGLGLPWYF